MKFICVIIFRKKASLIELRLKFKKAFKNKINNYLKTEEVKNLEKAKTRGNFLLFFF